MSNFVIETKDLTKHYKGNIGCENINLHLPKGKIYGLIGPNGAGKTTLLKMISGISFATRGSINLFGVPLEKGNLELTRIGTLIENPGLYNNFNAFDNLKFKAVSLGLYNDDRLLELLELVNLEPSNKKVKSFSTGMKQRLGIALSLVGNPDLLVLDEPINGLDPKGIVDIRNLLESLNSKHNITIILSSHMLEELSKIADYYGVIKDGRLLEELSKEDLVNKCRRKVEIVTDNPPIALTLIEELFNSREHRVLETGIIEVYDLLDRVGDINTELNKRGITVSSIATKDESLEEYFLKVTGGTLHA